MTTPILPDSEKEEVDPLEEFIDSFIHEKYPSCRKGKAFMDLWMLFDPLPSLSVIKKAIEEYSLQREKDKCIAFWKFCVKRDFYLYSLY